MCLSIALCVVFNLIKLTIRHLELICTLQTQQTINLSPSYFIISSLFLSILSKNACFKYFLFKTVPLLR